MEKVKKLGDPLPKKENIMNLVRFLSIFEDPNFRPGESKCEVEGDAVVLYPVEYHHAVYDFMDSCYREGVMFDFDWIKYSGRAKAIETRTPHYKDATLLQMCKILTGHIRCDRFVEAHIPHPFEPLSGGFFREGRRFGGCKDIISKAERLEVVELNRFEWFLEHSDVAISDDLDGTEMGEHRIGCWAAGLAAI